jgi:hypothetical protein
MGGIHETPVPDSGRTRTLSRPDVPRSARDHADVRTRDPPRFRLLRGSNNPGDPRLRVECLWGPRCRRQPRGCHGCRRAVVPDVPGRVLRRAGGVSGQSASGPSGRTTTSETADSSCGALCLLLTEVEHCLSIGCSCQRSTTYAANPGLRPRSCSTFRCVIDLGFSIGALLLLWRLTPRRPAKRSLHRRRCPEHDPPSSRIAR